MTVAPTTPLVKVERASVRSLTLALATDYRLISVEKTELQRIANEESP